jgi:hypothetical protein
MTLMLGMDDGATMLLLLQLLHLPAPAPVPVLLLRSCLPAPAPAPASGRLEQNGTAPVAPAAVLLPASPAWPCERGYRPLTLLPLLPLLLVYQEVTLAPGGAKKHQRDREGDEASGRGGTPLLLLTSGILGSRSDRTGDPTPETHTRAHDPHQSGWGWG